MLILIGRGGTRNFYLLIITKITPSKILRSGMNSSLPPPSSAPDYCSSYAQNAVIYNYC
jgi:hypothetical protein